MSAPRRAMVLAAGFGTRMKPLSDTLPKPLLRVGGRPLLDHVLDRLAAAGVTDAVVNVHHLARLIEDHLAAREGAPRIVVSDERDAILETGGGVRRALPFLGHEPFLVHNSDSIWIEKGRPALDALISDWDPDTMDVLLLLADRETSLGFDGAGDFEMDASGRLERRKGAAASFVFAGVSIMKPGLFGRMPDGAFSLNRVFDAAIASGRLSGCVLEGQWMHVGTPAALEEAERALARAG